MLLSLGIGFSLHHGYESGEHAAAVERSPVRLGVELQLSLIHIFSMEDVLEEIVGDIWDETDEVESEVVEKAEGEYELDGDMSISDFLELLGLSEESFDCESDTVGGWTLERFGGFPGEGDSFRYEDLEVTVLAMDGLRVDRVLVKRSGPEPGETEEN